MSVNTLIRRWNHQRIDAGRALALKVFRLLFDHLKLIPKDASLTTPRKILVLRLDGKLGDCITSTGFLYQLHQSFPQAEISILTAPQTASIFKSFPYLKVIPIKKGIVGTIKVWLKLRRESFDYIVNTSHIMAARTVFLISCLRAWQKISFNCPDYKLFSDHAIFDPLKDHVTVRYQSVLRVLGCKNFDVDYQLPIDEPGRMAADQAIATLKGAPYIVLNSFAGARLRNFSEVTTLKIIDHLAIQYPLMKVISMGNTGDLRILKTWQEKHPRDNWLVFYECGSLSANSRLIEKSSLVITPDTAVVHLASAFKKNLIAVYRADDGAEKNSKIWAPYKCPSKVIFSRIPPKEEGEPDINLFNIEEIAFDISGKAAFSGLAKT